MSHHPEVSQERRAAALGSNEGTVPSTQRSCHDAGPLSWVSLGRMKPAEREYLQVGDVRRPEHLWCRGRRTSPSRTSAESESSNAVLAQATPTRLELASKREATDD